MAKFCQNCGKELNDGADICLNCGKIVEKGKAQTENNSSNNNNTNSNAKSKMAAGILGILLGAFGVHNFYLGYTGKAVAQLLITLLSCFFLSPVSGIWGLVEGILILCGSIDKDANGRKLVN